MHSQGFAAPTGALGLRVIHDDGSSEPVLPPPAWPLRPATGRDILEHGAPRAGLPESVNRWRRSNLRNLWRGASRVLLARSLSTTSGFLAPYGQLWLKVFHEDGTVDDLGLASMRLVTTAGVGFIVDAFQNLTELENMKFHGFGVGTTAEAVGDTALVTEETTQYVTDNTRPTGSQTENGANVYRTVATYSPDSGTSPRPITEHGIFSQAATGGGTLLDRSVFSAVNLVTSADSLQATYDFTVASGG